MSKHLAFLLYALILLSSHATAQKQTQPPNVVFILADDLGYGELGCYGQKRIQTPNIDRLAAEGLRFTQHYAGAPVCGPSRCVLMTGKHLAHAEIRANKEVRPHGQWPLAADTLTLAEVFKQAGYATGAFGKWGLGPSESSGSPIKQGFDRFYGYNCQRHAHSYFPQFLDSDEGRVQINPEGIPGHQAKPQGQVDAADYRGHTYAPDLILEQSLTFIDHHKDQPFFLYLPFVEPHLAMQPPPAWLDRYPASWDAPKAGGKGVYRGQNGYLPHDRPRAAYAAMISDLDEHVGSIMQRLKQHGIDENTLVVFTSDNGATHRGKDPRFNIGGVDTDFFNSSGGLRGFKGSCYEGGLRVPCIVRWPGKVSPGSRHHEASYFADWFATLATLIQQPDATQHADGINLLPALKGKAIGPRSEPMIWEFTQYGGIVAIRQGRWKALRRGLLKKARPWELYDIKTDPQESRNLATQHPEVVTRLEAAWLATRRPEPDFPLPLADPATPPQ